MSASVLSICENNMTIGIYAITHVASGRTYIGKAVNIERRLAFHRKALTGSVRNNKTTNRLLWEDVARYGIGAFAMVVAAAIPERDDKKLFEMELQWINAYMAMGLSYNLRRDTSDGMFAHDSTRKLLSDLFSGSDNPNYANNWSDEQKETMSNIAKSRHASGEFYGDEWRAKIAASSVETWADPALRARVSRSVSLAKRKYNFIQMDRDGTHIRTWESVEDIVKENPSYKWQNIYSVCNGYKPTYRGFKWSKILK